MILTAHQPVYLPWLGLFHKIALANRFVSFNQVQYQAKDWNNRNKIKTPQGPIWMTVPVLRKGRLEKSYQEIDINNSINWGGKQWQALRLNYAKAPFFSKYADYFEDVYSRDWRTLAELNESMLQWFVETLGIGIKIESAGDFDFQGTKSDLVLDMCRQIGATTYIFGAHGREYADRTAFEAEGVNLYFQDYTHPEYPQLSGKFEPYMSIVDLLFNCGDESLDVLTSGNLSRLDLEGMF